jgi:hypothetical protein
MNSLRSAFRGASWPVCIDLKLCSSNCASVNRRHKDVPSYVNGSRRNIAWLMLGAGKADACAIVGCAKISSGLGRYAVVHNLHVLARSQQKAAEV